MSYRIAIGEIAHETNTFCQEPTRIDAFKRFMWLKGEEIVAMHGGTRTYLGGMLDKAAELEVIPVPLFATMAQPSGIITSSTYRKMLEELLTAIERAMPVDAICLSLHGAGVVEGIDDLEGSILAAVRRSVGADMPVAVTLDLHANLTQNMLDQADGLFGVNFFPHTDSYERGAEAVSFLYQVLQREIKPVMYLERLPMMITANSTDLEPGKRLNALCWEWETRQGVVDCTIFHGFPYADTPAVGMSVLVLADGDIALAREAAQTVARAVWKNREAYRPQILDPAQAIECALAIEDGPIVINDTSDNPGGGAPGDSTHLLRSMIEANTSNACYAFICDPDTVQHAHRAGTGTVIDVRLGGKTDTVHGSPIASEAYVKVLTDGRFRLTTPMWQGLEVDLGLTARMRIGGIDVLVSSERQQVLDDEVFLLHGIDVRRYKIVAVKSAAHFRAGYNHLAKAIITADTPGATARRLQEFPFQRIRRPMWPLDPGAM